MELIFSESRESVVVTVEGLGLGGGAGDDQNGSGEGGGPKSCPEVGKVTGENGEAGVFDLLLEAAAKKLPCGWLKLNAPVWPRVGDLLVSGRGSLAIEFDGWLVLLRPKADEKLVILFGEPWVRLARLASGWRETSTRPARASLYLASHLALHVSK